MSSPLFRAFLGRWRRTIATPATSYGETRRGCARRAAPGRASHRSANPSRVASRPKSPTPGRHWSTGPRSGEASRVTSASPDSGWSFLRKVSAIEESPRRPLCCRSANPSASRNLRRPPLQIPSSLSRCQQRPRRRTRAPRPVKWRDPDRAATAWRPCARRAESGSTWAWTACSTRSPSASRTAPPAPFSRVGSPSAEEATGSSTPA